MYKRYWLVTFWYRGFESKLFIYGSERDLWDYVETEIGDCSYHGATAEEIEAGKAIGMNFYIVPKTTH